MAGLVVAGDLQGSGHHDETRLAKWQQATLQSHASQPEMVNRLLAIDPVVG
jgi:hypothetical protein